MERTGGWIAFSFMLEYRKNRWRDEVFLHAQIWMKLVEEKHFLSCLFINRGRDNIFFHAGTAFSVILEVDKPVEGQHFLSCLNKPVEGQNFISCLQ
jgi:hypothetical protein